MRFVIFLLKLNNSNKVLYLRSGFLFLKQSPKPENQKEPEKTLSISKKRPGVFNSRYLCEVHLIGYIKSINKTQTDHNNKGQIFIKSVNSPESCLKRGLKDKDLTTLFINSLNKLLKKNIKNNNLISK